MGDDTDTAAIQPLAVLFARPEGVWFWPGVVVAATMTSIPVAVLSAGLLGVPRTTAVGAGVLGVTLAAFLAAARRNARSRVRFTDSGIAVSVRAFDPNARRIEGRSLFGTEPITVDDDLAVVVRDDRPVDRVLGTGSFVLVRTDDANVRIPHVRDPDEVLDRLWDRLASRGDWTAPAALPDGLDGPVVDRSEVADLPGVELSPVPSFEFLTAGGDAGDPDGSEPTGRETGDAGGADRETERATEGTG